jgi:hypothetical protein
MKEVDTEGLQTIDQDDRERPCLNPWLGHRDVATALDLNVQAIEYTTENLDSLSVRTHQ